MSFLKFSNPDGGPLTMEQRRQIAELIQAMIDAAEEEE